jgi:hypothetical protein
MAIGNYPYLYPLVNMYLLLCLYLYEYGSFVGSSVPTKIKHLHYTNIKYIHLNIIIKFLASFNHLFKTP